MCSMYCASLLDRLKLDEAFGCISFYTGTEDPSIEAPYDPAIFFIF